VERPASVLRLRDHVDAAACGERPDDALAVERMVVRDDHAHLLLGVDHSVHRTPLSVQPGSARPRAFVIPPTTDPDDRADATSEDGPILRPLIRSGAWACTRHVPGTPRRPYWNVAARVAAVLLVLAAAAAVGTELAVGSGSGLKG